MKTIYFKDSKTLNFETKKSKFQAILPLVKSPTLASALTLFLFISSYETYLNAPAALKIPATFAIACALSWSFTLLCWVLGSALAFCSANVQEALHKVRVTGDAVPFLPLSLLVLFALGQGNVSIVLGLTLVMVVMLAPYISIMMQDTLSLMKEDYFINKRLTGISDIEILFFDILPTMKHHLPKYCRKILLGVLALDIGATLTGFSPLYFPTTSGLILEEATLSQSPLLLISSIFVLLVLARLALKTRTH